MTETGIVALVGTGTTALVAIIGLLVNAGQAKRAAAREQNRQRYDELMKLYSDVGESISASLEAFTTARDVLMLADKSSAITAVTEAFEKANRTNAAHRGRLLRLYGAGGSVRDAYQRLSSAIMSFPQDVEALAGDEGAVRIDEVATLVREFYEVAGEDARSVLRSGR